MKGLIWKAFIFGGATVGLSMPIAWALSNFLVVEKPLRKADAIVVLSGSTEYLERTREAARLFKQGIAPRILLTNDGLKGGWNQEKGRNPYFVEREEWELVAEGVPKDAIEVLPGVVGGTDDEAELLAKVVPEKQLTSLLIVTSAYHSRRALWTFTRTLTKYDIKLDVGINSPPNAEQTPPAFDWWLSKHGCKIVVSEYAKMLYHLIAG